MISRWQGNNGTVLDKSCFLDLDLHTDTNNFAPNEVQRGCQSLRSFCLQSIKTQGIMIMIATGSKSRKVNKRVNSDENMYRGPVMFTSDVSLPKDDKTAMRGKQITAGQLTRLKTHHNAYYATKKGRGSKAWEVCQKSRPKSNGIYY